MKSIAQLSPVVLSLGLLNVLGSRAISQTITPTTDSTGTRVNFQTNSQQFHITGGIQANHNLFHSFQQFGLDANQTAISWSRPGIENIFGRVAGGEASLINGRIQVSGGPANLYLMNPAGIVFGSGASLNVPAAFTATTASGIGFNSGLPLDASQSASPSSQIAWFNAVGPTTIRTWGASRIPLPFQRCNRAPCSMRGGWL